MVKSQQQKVGEKRRAAEVRKRNARSKVPLKNGDKQRPSAISKAVVGRLATISRVKKMGGECHDLLIDEADRFLGFVIPCAIKITVHSGRKTISVQDVLEALENFAELGPYYGYE
jgi:histone H3/H4